MGAANTRRLAERIGQIVAEMLERRIKDPRLGFVTVTETRLTNDLREATVFYTVYGSPEEQAETAAALRSATGVIRSEVGRIIGLRHYAVDRVRGRRAAGQRAADRRPGGGGAAGRRRARPRPRGRGVRRRSGPLPQAGRRRRRLGRRGRMTAASGLVIVDKPGGMTSHDVVARIRRLAHTRRVGHAGTLDPMATGVLVVGIEKATRLLGHLTLTEKTYEATIRLGQSTTTDDAEGESSRRQPRRRRRLGRGADRGDREAHRRHPPGPVKRQRDQGQRPARLQADPGGRGAGTGRPPGHNPRVHDPWPRQDGDFLDIDARIRCSSGTYIRAIARDLGAALGTGGHLTALRRTAVGPYDLSQAHTLEDLSERIVATPLAEAAAAAFPRIDLTAEDARRLAQGVRHPARRPLPVLAPCPRDRRPRARHPRSPIGRVCPRRHTSRLGHSRLRPPAVPCRLRGLMTLPLAPSARLEHAFGAIG